MKVAPLRCQRELQKKGRAMMDRVILGLLGLLIIFVAAIIVNELLHLITENGLKAFLTIGLSIAALCDIVVVIVYMFKRQ